MLHNFPRSENETKREHERWIATRLEFPPRKIAFTNVRHPFDRLVSAFYNLRRKKSKKTRGPDMRTIKFLRKTTGVKQENLTFAQFVDILTSPEDAHPSFFYHDRHWDPYMRACRICSETYSYITRTETSAHDSAPVLQLLGYPQDYLKQSNASKHHIPRPNELKKLAPVIRAFPYSKHLPEFQEIDWAVRKKLYERYKADFQGLGYHFDFNTNTAFCSIETDSGERCC